VSKQKKENQITKVMKYEIIKPIDESWEDVGEILRDIQYHCTELANKVITVCWDFNGMSRLNKEQYGSYLGSKLPDGQPLRTFIRQQFLEQYKRLPSDIYDCMIGMAMTEWNKNFGKIITRESFIPSFRKDVPIELHSRQIKIKKENEYYQCDLTLLSQSYADELNRTGRNKCQVKFGLRVKGDSPTSIMKKVLVGEYKIGQSKLERNKKKGKWFLILSYSFEKEKTEGLDVNKIMGVDLGLNVPAYVAFNDDSFKGKAIGTKKEIISFKKQVESRKRELSKQASYCGDGRIGHGRRTRLKPVDKIGEKISNFRKLKNHCYSRTIVDLAVQHGCGTIQMENLQGILENKDEIPLLKYWTPHDLLEKVKYKAKEKGIEVNIIDPSYTSARCCKCGHIHNSNNKNVWRPNQEQFKCMKCDYGHKFFVNADYNAAKNIATPGIEEIIQEQLKKQDKEVKHNLKYAI
jgi:putative transposase